MKTALLDNRLLRTREIAERLGVTERTIDNYVANGRIPSIALSPRCRRFDPAAVERALKNPHARF